ncbi:MAG TPA: hypothetical protein VJ851_05360 [Jatrophihabitans sp.]|nr:hypothetical protein [Jatrophihabitans sp.]
MKANRMKAVVLAGGAAVAVLGSSAPALAFDSGGLHLEVTPLSPATLVARGAAVDVPIDVECNGDFADMHVEVDEQVGGQLATGQTDVSVTCTGAHETLLVRVTASLGNRPFSKGQAVVTAQLFSCTFTGICGQPVNSVTVQVTK